MTDIKGPMASDGMDKMDSANFIKEENKKVFGHLE